MTEAVFHMPIGHYRANSGLDKMALDSHSSFFSIKCLFSILSYSVFCPLISCIFDELTFDGLSFDVLSHTLLPDHPDEHLFSQL